MARNVIFSETFQSISSLINTVKNREVNSVFENTQSSLDKSKYYQDFTGTKNYEEAENLALTGDYESYKKIEKISGALKVKNCADSYKKTIEKNVCGFAPNVPLYIIGGTPKNMYNIVQKKVKSNVINITIDNAGCGSYNSNDLAKAATKVFSVISELEKRNYRINLYIFNSTYADNEIMEIKVKIKDSGSPFNRLRCAFPIVNPSFLRRLIFRWKETIPVKINRQWCYCHGWRNTDFTPQKNEKIISLYKILTFGKSIDDIIKDVTE